MLRLQQNIGETQERHLHEVYAAAVMLYIALLSEVAIACRLDQERARLHTIWRELNGFKHGARPMHPCKVYLFAV